ncbi:MAG: 7-cyano-7-deazaguanine synthase [Panacagrimonas sp.]
MLAAKALRVSAAPGVVRLRGDVDQDLILRADKMLQSLPDDPTPRAVDLMTIAAGAYAVDRAVKRKPRPGNQAGIRWLCPRFCVNDAAYWSSHEATRKVTEILHFLTGDQWQVSFERAESSLYERHQERLGLEWPRPDRIALYSGGLDSAAGLANQLLDGHQNYLLVTVRHQFGLRFRCQKQIRELAQHLKLTEPMHCTLNAYLSKAVAGDMKRQEPSQRSRGFLFGVAAALVARACDLHEVEVFENGVGAINLPLTSGGLSGGLATRGAHPSFLRMLSSLVSSVMEREMRFSLPFMEKTKGEMLLKLKANQLERWAELSHSCVHTSPRVRGQPHCGQCPACIERRQAFAVAGISETHTYKTDVFATDALKPEWARYLRSYWDESTAWGGDDFNALRRMCTHLRSTEVPAQNHAAVLDRQRRHAREIAETFSGAPLLNVGRMVRVKRNAQAATASMGGPP